MGNNPQKEDYVYGLTINKSAHKFIIFGVEIQKKLVSTPDLKA